MSNNIDVTPGTGKTVATEEIGTTQYQKIKVVGGETGSTSVWGITPDGSAKVSVIGTVNTALISTNASIITVGTAVANQSVSGTVGASIIGTVPVVQSGTVISSISGNVGASIIGTVPVTQAGSWTQSVVGSVSINSVIGAITVYAQPDSFVSGVTSILTGTSAASVIAAPGASLRNYITQITVTNAAATAAIVDIKDSGANVLHSGYAAASGGGFTATFPVPLKQLTTNASIDAVPRSQASIIVAASGYKAA
jgi:hypothetical protein